MAFLAHFYDSRITCVFGVQVFPVILMFLCSVRRKHLNSHAESEANARDLAAEARRTAAVCE
jgi:hypothetical protein